MSSPPNYATSPPYPGSISLPKKRPSNSALGPAGTKRRKPSTSSTSHPLRQTSFPPPEGYPGDSRSPSFSPTVDDSLSVAGGRTARSVTGASSVGGGRGRRGRKSGNADARSSVRGRSEAADGRGSVVDGVGGARAEDGDAEDEEGEGEEGEDAVLEGKEDEATWKMQREHLAMLVNAFNDDQMDRYNIWRRIKLKKETVRKLTNQTLSQSVGPGIIMAINGYTKVFIGELIERAREVQTEWLAASDTLPTGEVKLPQPHLRPNAKTIPSQEGSSMDTNTDTQDTQKHDKPTETETRINVEERDRGPLTPDHLREAVRRYKKDREGGSAGFQGLSLQGKEVVAGRVGGRKLFR